MKRSQGKNKTATRAAGSGFGAGASGFGGFGGSDGRSSLSYLAEPPSLSAVSDPNVVVCFKSVLKKDSTTKAKALEDLVTYVQAHPYEQDGGVEEAVLDVWVQLYPRISIDNSRRVRELSHTLQYELMKSARKRMERHVPSIVGAWLAGLYDRDRAVSRAANDGLASFLSTPDKVASFWKKCHAQILDYSIDAVQETQETLSDERSTTKEDSEAKYFRVLTAGLSLVLGLLQKLDISEIEKLQEQYETFFRQESVWKSITFDDVSVRKTVCHLLFVSLDRKLPYIDQTKVKQAFITGGLRTNQIGSALEYVRATTKLSQVNPDIWASSGEKKSPLTRLCAFISKGSQGSPPKFWEHLDQLLSLVPSSILTLENSSALLTSVKSGVTNREEPRTNTSPAWKCYIDTAQRLLNNLSPDDQLAFGREHLFPLLEQFLFSVSEKTRSIPIGPNAMSVLVEAYISLANAQQPLVAAFSEEWDRLANTFQANIAGSLPEVSQEFKTSQEKIAEEGRRWFSFVGLLHQKLKQLDQKIQDYTAEPSVAIISRSISLLENRNLKPFGAANLLEYALSTSPHLFDDEKWTAVFNFLTSTAESDIAKALESPSSRYLISCVGLLGSFNKGEEYTTLWNKWVGAVLQLEEGPLRNNALASLISHPQGSELSKCHTKLQETMVSLILGDIGSETGAWDLLEAVVSYEALTGDRFRTITRNLVETIGGTNHAEHNSKAFQALEILVKGHPQLFAEDVDLHAALIAILLRLTEFDNPSISGKARAIRALLDSHSGGQLPVAGIIHTNLERAGPHCLEIETIFQQAQNASNISLEEKYPNTNVWMQELRPLLHRRIAPTLSVTSIVEGATALIPADDQDYSVLRDGKGRSIPVRMSLYLNRLLLSDTTFSTLPQQFRVELLYLHSITTQLVSDQITALSTRGPWHGLGELAYRAEAEELVSSAKTAIYGALSLLESDSTAASIDESSDLNQLVDLLVKGSGELGNNGLHCSRVLAELIQAASEIKGLTRALEERFWRPEILKATPSTALLAAAAIGGFGEAARSSKAVSTFCNRLISDVAAANPEAEKTHMTLVLLTLTSRVYESGELPVTNSNRIVFAVKQIVSWLEEPEKLSASFRAEICRALAQLLPCMTEVYGAYWEKTLEFCVSLWNQVPNYEFEDALPFIHSSLRLYKVLESLPEPNDDLQDALKDFAEEKSRALLELIKKPRIIISQPLEIVDGIICREVQKIPTRHVPDLGDIFPLVASESPDIQTAAFALLHRAIPAQQEQQAVEALLDKTDARLPDELLSLLLDAPTLDSYPEEWLVQFPSPIRSYLLAWKLIFDAFASSPFKLRGDFTEHLKSENYVTPLLDFMFDVLGHSAAHAIKLDKAGLGVEQIKDYDIKLADAEPEEKRMQWLLVHLYYLTLKYIPGLFRSWYLDCRSKQTKIAVEAWMTKYFTPLIVEEALDEVQDWADSQEPPPADEQELSVKVSKPGREVTAGYEVDESLASIVIKVPPSYPIESVSVSSLNRVAVTERKWQSWIMTTQGVITFSNGNIIDGLQVFKRNIVGALKGQGECAICYSIISTDKRMPDKRCTTCKNLFHRTCLYKWFQSSNQNTCPLCRNPIDYLGADTAKRRQN